MCPLFRWGSNNFVPVVHPSIYSVKDIVHERTWLKGSIYDVQVCASHCNDVASYTHIAFHGPQIDTVCETRDKDHANTLLKELEETYGHRLVSWGGKPINRL